LLKPFPKYGLKDKGLYMDWLKEQLRRDKPKVLIPCHGNVVRDTALHKTLGALADAGL